MADSVAETVGKLEMAIELIANELVCGDLVAFRERIAPSLVLRALSGESFDDLMIDMRLELAAEIASRN